jgi:transposase-like protein
MNLYQISKTFPTEISATDYLEYVRWGKNPHCSNCGSDKISKRYADLRYHCSTCRGRFSVTTGTHLENTNLSLVQWIMSFALISDAKKGISAKQLERNIGVSYPTAWGMYHKIRTFMTDGEIKLKGLVEADETYIGGKPRKYQSAKYKTPFEHDYLDGKLENLGINLLLKTLMPIRKREQLKMLKEVVVLIKRLWLVWFKEMGMLLPKL